MAKKRKKNIITRLCGLMRSFTRRENWFHFENGCRAKRSRRSPYEVLSLLQEVKDLIEAHNSGQENADEQLLSRHAKDRLGHCLQCNNIRETPPNGERCRLLLSLHVRKKLPCRVLDSDDGRWSFSRKGTALDVKPDWKACTQYWQPVVGLNCWGVGHLAQSFC